MSVPDTTPPPRHPDPEGRRNAGAINRALFVDRLAAALPIWLYALGAAILMLKLTGRSAAIHEPLKWGLTGWTFLVPLGYAFAAARRDRYSPEYALAWLDWKNHAGGRILSGAPGAAGPVRIRPGMSPGPFFRRLPLPALFVAVALWTPAPTGDDGHGPPSGEAVRRRVEAMTATVKAIEEQEALPKTVAGDLLEQLEGLARLAEQQPEAAAEGVGAVRRKLEDAMLSRVDAGLRGYEAAQELRSAAFSGEAAAEAMPSLRAFLDALARLARAEGGQDELPPALRAALAKALSEVGAADLAALAERPELLAELTPETLEALTRALEDAAKANLAAAQGGAALPGMAASLDDLLRTHPSAAALAAAGFSGSGRSGMPSNLASAGDSGPSEGGGQGGASRGGGDSPLTFGQESDASGARFVPKALTTPPDLRPGAPAVMVSRDRRLLAESPPPAEFAPTRRTGVDVAGPVRAGDNAPPLGPKRQQAAERYFERLSRNE